MEIIRRIHNKTSSEKSVPINSVLDSGSFRILGIDYGEKRIGLAISDESRTLARELTILSPKEFWRQIQGLINQYRISRIVIGWPLNMKGGETAQTRKIRNFKFQISKKTKLPIEIMDERLSSVMTKNLPGGRRHKDSLSAQIILQNYLDSLKDV